MEAIEMVRCFLQKEGDDGRSIRFVPLEIFGLWRVLMVKVHGFTLLDPQVSQWVPDESEYEAYAKYSEADYDRVIEVRFKYKEGDAQRPIVRYFPVKGYQKIFGYFRNHFPDESKMDGFGQRYGRYLKTKAVPYLAP